MGQLFSDPGVLASFQDLEIDPSFLSSMTDMLYTDETTEAPISALVALLLNLRGDRPCRMADMVVVVQVLGFRTEREIHRITAEVKCSIHAEVARISEKLMSTRGSGISKFSTLT